MANRNFASGGKIYSMHVMPVVIDCTIAIGASGAVSSIKGPLVSSVTRTGTGTYKINLSNNFNRCFMVVGAAQSAAGGLSGIMAVECQNAPDAAVQSLSAPAVTIKTLDVTGAAANPASGSSISVLIYLSNSSVTIQGE